MHSTEFTALAQDADAWGETIEAFAPLRESSILVVLTYNEDSANHFVHIVDKAKYRDGTFKGWYWNEGQQAKRFFTIDGARTEFQRLT